jgi:hypothetical protein
LIGMVVQMSAESGVDAPVYNFLYAALKPGEMKARGG